MTLDTEKLVIGVDIGGTNTKFGLVNATGNIIAKGRIKTDQYSDPEDFVKALHAEVNKMTAAFPNCEIKGIGIGAPNANYYTGIIEHAPNLPWKGVVPFSKIINETFNLDVEITNDANAAALGEMIFGAAKGMNDFIMITLGTGVGSGIVANGNVIYGHDGYAGELGHTIVKPGGRKHWSTGSKGSLEAYASATGISITAKKMRAEHPSSLLNNYHEDDINSKTVFECASKGDEVAIEVFRYTGQILGQALANFVMFSSPKAIFLFGGVIQAGELIRKPTQLHMEKNLMAAFKNKVELIFSELDEADAAILGASALIWKNHI